MIAGKDVNKNANNNAWFTKLWASFLKFARGRVTLSVR